MMPNKLPRDWYLIAYTDVVVFFSHREMFDVHVAAAGEGKAKLYHSNSSILPELEQTASKQNVCYSGGWCYFCAQGFLFALSSMLVASDN